MMWFLIFLAYVVLAVIIFLQRKTIRTHDRTFTAFQKTITLLGREASKLYMENINLTRINQRRHNQIGELEEQVSELRTNYQHLEEGRNEQEDNYEQQFLAFEEKVALWNEREELLLTTIVNLEEEHKFHEDHCLPVLNHMRQAIDKPKPEMLELVRMRLLIEREFPETQVVTLAEYGAYEPFVKKIRNPNNSED